MNDCELLTLAVKAANYTLTRFSPEGDPVIPNVGFWNPLKKNGPAANLEMRLDFYPKESKDGITVGSGKASAFELYADHPDRDAARRRAGVRAAAEIGKAMSAAQPYQRPYQGAYQPNPTFQSLVADGINALAIGHGLVDDNQAVA